MTNGQGTDFSIVHWACRLEEHGQPPPALLRGISLSEYGWEGFSSTVEEVVRVRFCCLLR